MNMEILYHISRIIYLQLMIMYDHCKYQVKRILAKIVRPVLRIAMRLLEYSIKRDEKKQAKKKD